MTTTTVPTASGDVFGSGGLGMRKTKDKIATGVIWGSFLLALIPLIWLLSTVVSRGLPALLREGWFSKDQYGIGTRSKATGGVIHAVIGTFQQVAVASVIAVPISLLVAIYLIEYGQGRFAKVASFMIDILTGIPSIVAALFVYAVFVTTLGGDKQGFYVSLALVMLMIPVVVRSTEEMLRLVPNELREASYALGVPKWKTILRIVLPTALSGIVTGVMLGVARIAGETAPLIVLVGYAQNTNWDLFGGSQGSLPGMIYDQSKNVDRQLFSERMWGAALTLIIIVMLLNIAARFFTRFSKISN